MIGGVRGVAPPNQHLTDDADGHRIYLNPWAADPDDEDDEIPVGLVEEYRNER